VPSSNITPAEHTARHLRAQAADCRELSSPLYGGLLDHTAADLEAGGPAAVLLADHLADRAPGLLALRLLGGVHAHVLARHAPELAMYYPSVGGTADPGLDADLAWPAFRALLHDHAATLRPWLDRAPQTNEIGRGVALVGALRHLVAAADLPIRLVEVGASAGLNLRADLAHITGAGTTHGDPTSPAQLIDAWQGAPPPATVPRIVERTGGDLHPIDATTTEGRLTLTAYVWADQAERIERLRGGLALAGQVSVDLRAEPASATLGRVAVSTGHWTVLWHSIFRQYLSDAEYDAMTAAIGEIADTATDAARFAHVFLEPADRSGSGDVEVVLTTWPGGRRQLLGVAAAHGIPTTWLGQPRLQTEEVS
jgi:hypothetical protein